MKHVGAEGCGFAGKVVEKLLARGGEDAVEVSCGISPFAWGAELLGANLKVGVGLRYLRIDAGVGRGLWRRWEICDQK